MTMTKKQREDSVKRLREAVDKVIQHCLDCKDFQADSWDASVGLAEDLRKQVKADQAVSDVFIRRLERITDEEDDDSASVEGKLCAISDAFLLTGGEA